jgi:hypothetical protein
MLRVTIELVPFGVEAMSKTIAELCIANTGTEDNIANYEVAGYQVKTDNKIEEFAGQITSYDRNQGALNLVAEVLLAPNKEFDEVKQANKLLSKTRLMNTEENND